MRVEQAQAGAPGGRYAVEMTKRTDRLTAARVDMAINLAGIHGVHAGAAELARLGLPIELAQRVLLRPAERRGTSVRAALLQPPATAPAAAR